MIVWFSKIAAFPAMENKISMHTMFIDKNKFLISPLKLSCWELVEIL